MSPRIKVAYLCDLSPLESWTYSGGNSQIFKALNDHVGDVDIIGNQWGYAELLRRALHHMPERINLRARWRTHLILSRVIATDVHRQLSAKHYDVLFCPYSFQSLAGIRPPYPIISVFSSDATFSTYRQSEVGAHFGSNNTMSGWFDSTVLKHEKQVFQSQDLNLWPSVWQKELADTLYDLTDDQSVMVPWGANIADPGLPEHQAVLSGDRDLRLLFIGRDWQAKGGPIAFEVLQDLRSQGVNARLDVVGCNPPACHQNAHVTVHPNLNKSDPKQLRQFNALLEQSHFLVMASFESFGFAFCEASAFGLPSLCLRVGGIPIVDGVNGHALEKDAKPAELCAKILQYMADPDAYSALRKSARAYYETTLNWDAWGQRVAALIQEKRIGNNLERRAR